MRPLEMAAISPANVLSALWRVAEQPELALDAIKLTGEEPALRSSFAVGTAAQATIAAAALAAGELWRLRTGRRQGISVDMRDAAIEFRSERYLLRLDGAPIHDGADKIEGLYLCGDGRWARLHARLPHHRDGLLALLGCDHDRAAVQRTLDGWRAEVLEAKAADAGLVVTACRSFAEWDEHPQGRAISRLPVFSIDRIGDAPAEPLTAADRPLTGVRVLFTACWTGKSAGFSPLYGALEVKHYFTAFSTSPPRRPYSKPLNYWGHECQGAISILSTSMSAAACECGVSCLI